MRKLFVKEVSIMLFLVMLLSISAIAEIDSVFMGTYDLLNDSVPDAVPIEWYVIGMSENSCTLLSRYAVAQRRINSVPETSWKKTELYRWLNNDFFEEAFSGREKQIINGQNGDYVSLLIESDGKSGNTIIRNNPEIMLLEQTDEFQQKKWWTRHYPSLWLGLGSDRTKIRPAYDAKLFSNDVNEGGMGYYEAATYYAIEEDKTAPYGYSVLKYGYPLNEPLAVRPVITIDRAYALELMGITAPNGSRAIVVDELVEAIHAIKGKVNIVELLQPFFGDFSSIEYTFSEQTQELNLYDFDWNGFNVKQFQLRLRRVREASDMVLINWYISVIDDSEKSEHTGSIIYSDTIQYYNENWERIPISEQVTATHRKKPEGAGVSVGYSKMDHKDYATTVVGVQHGLYDTEEERIILYVPEEQIEEKNADEEQNGDYEEVSCFYDGLAAVKKNGRYGCIDENGNLVIPCQWHQRIYFVNGYAAVLNNAGQYGVIDTSGKLIIPCEWEYINLGNGYFDCAVVGRDKKYGVIALSGEMIVPCEYESIESYGFNGMAAVRMNNKWGYIDAQGELVIPCQWDETRGFTVDLALVCKDGKYGYINEKGELVIPCVWDDASWTHTGIADVKKNGKAGFINKDGKLVIDCVWDDVRSYTGGDYVFVQKEGKWGVVDLSGNIVVSCAWDDIQNFYLSAEKYICVQMNGKWGAIDLQGNVVVPCEWELSWRDFPYFSENMLRVAKNGKYGFVDAKGNIIVDCEWDQASNFSDGYSIVSKNGKQGVIDYCGNLVIPCEYDMIQESQGKFVLLQNGKVSVSDLSSRIEILKDENEENIESDNVLPIVDEIEKNSFWKYEVNNNGAVITGFEGSIEGDIIIPDHIDGYPVVGLGNNLFSQCDNLKSVVVPEGVTFIDYDVFDRCIALEQVVLPEGLVRIGAGAFYGCEELHELIVPDGVTELGEAAFAYSGIRKIKLPSSLKVIKRDCFELSKLRSIVIPDGVETIEEWAFCQCWDLERVSIPDSVTKIGHQAFIYCENLKEINLPPYINEISGAMFCYTNIKEMVIPDGVKAIRVQAFLHSALKQITIPANVTEFEEDAFPKGLETIIGEKGSAAQELAESLGVTFKEMAPVSAHEAESIKHEQIESRRSMLKSAVQNQNIDVPLLTMDDSSEHLGFGYHGNRDDTGRVSGIDLDILADIEIPEFMDGNRIVGIDDSGLEACDLIRNAIVPEGITAFGYNAFRECSSLEHVSMPESLLAIHAGAFEHCVNLKEAIIPDSVSVIGEATFNGCISLKTVRLPKNLKVIESELFQLCENLERIDIPSGVVSIKKWAFYHCDKLRILNLPDSLTEIGDYAFSRCGSLEELMIPKSVESIGMHAFKNSGIKRIIVEDGMKTLDITAILNTGGIDELRIPESVIQIKWSGLYAQGNIKRIVGVKGTAAYSLAVDLGIEFVEMEEDVLDMSEKKAILTFDVPDGFELVDKSVLKYEAEEQLGMPETRFARIAGSKGKLTGNIAFPQNEGAVIVKEIGSWSFYNTKGITGVAIPEGVERIGSHAFYKCTGIEEIVLPSSLKYIDDYAFCDCENLISITIPQSVEFIGTWAFGRCYKLKTIQGKTGSAAEKLAKELRIEFQPIK